MHGKLSRLRKTIYASQRAVSRSFRMIKLSLTYESLYRRTWIERFNFYNFRLYRERITQVDTKLGEVRVGKSEEYLVPLERLKENMKTKTEVAGILKQYRLQNIQNKFLAEEQAALQNFESEKELIWDCIHNDLQEKIRRLEEDRNNVDIHADLWLNSNGRRRRNHTERRRAVSVAGPYIVYMLNDADILEDWALIKKSLSSRKTEII